MKKNNLFGSIVKLGVAAAAIGGTVYLLKDKIAENPTCKEAIDKAKDTLKNYMPKKEEDFVEDDFVEDDFVEDDFEIPETEEKASDRGYVTIPLPSETEEEPEA